MLILEILVFLWGAYMHKVAFLVLVFLIFYLIYLIFHLNDKLYQSLAASDQVKKCGYFLGIQTVRPLYISKNINGVDYWFFELKDGEVDKFRYIPKIHKSMVLNLKVGSRVCYYYSLKYKDDHNNYIISNIQ